MTDSSPIKDVSDTAFMVAAYRALESERARPLFHDPLAGRLSGETGKKILQNLPRRVFFGGWTVVIRTCVIDELIRWAILEGIDTVLNLGAGLDTRPYRLDLPGSLRWIEVDFPRVIEFKEGRLTGERPKCRLERLGLDLADDSERRAFLSGLATSCEKILVLTEGVIPYLKEEEVGSLAADLRSRSGFVYWIADYFSPQTYEYRRRRGVDKIMKNAPFQFEPKDYFGFFRQLSWEPKQIRYLVEEGEKLKRPIPLPWPLKLKLKLVRLILPAEKRASLKRLMGYVLFEPGCSIKAGNSFSRDAELASGKT